MNDQLWVASTPTGFNKFNGIVTRHYLLNDTICGLSGSYIQSALYKDSSGKLWTTTYEKICNYDPDSEVFDCYSLDIDGEKMIDNYHIFHSQGDTLFVRIANQLVLFDIKSRSILFVLGQTKGSRFSYYNNQIIACPWVFGIGIEQWINEKGRWFRNDITFSECTPDLKNIQFSQCLIVDDYYWLVSNKGLISYDSEVPCLSKVFQYNNEPTHLIHAVKWHNFIVITTKKGQILFFDINKRSFVNSLSISSKGLQLEHSDVSELFVDRKHNLWITSKTHGVQKFSERSIKAFLKNRIYNNSKWQRISANTNYLSYLDGNRNLFVELVKDEPNEPDMVEIIKVNKLTKSVSINKNEFIYFDYHDLFKYNIRTKKALRVITDLPNQINDILMYNDSLYLVSGFNLYSSDILNLKFKQDKSKNHLNRIVRIETISDEVRSFSYGSYNYWITSAHIDTTIKLPSYINRATYDPNTKNHYVATNAGLYSVDENYKLSHLKPNPWQIGKQTVDNLKYHNGAVYMTVDDRVAQYDLETDQLTYFSEDTFEGTPVFDIRDSTIFIANKYVSEYTLDEAFGQDDDIKMHVEEILVNGEKWKRGKIDISGPIELDYQQNNISVSHCLNNWYNATLSKVRYKVEPYHTEWTMATNCEEIQLPLLPPGEYTYHVQGIKPSSALTEVQTIEFDISPPWWKSIWFYILCAAGFLGIVYALYRYRIGQLKKSIAIDQEIIQLEKSALQAQMNPHFIFNCLNSIQGFIMNNDKEQAMEYLGKFAKLIRLSLNASVDSMITLDQEIILLESYLSLEQLRADNSFTYQIECDPNIEAELLQIPPMLIQPFAENAVIHGMKKIQKGGQISIQFTKSSNALLVAIIDNGKYETEIKEEKKYRSLGMGITKKRLEHINNTTSEKYNIRYVPIHQGTHVEVTISLT